jgi:hypothetical protein
MAAVSHAPGADAPDAYRHEDRALNLVMIPRTPQQMAAFYEARGFPKAARELIREACVITTGIQNKSDQVVWLELERWRFVSERSAVKRIRRDYWRGQWARLDLPRAKRSTFEWTLMPEVRDLQPGEPVGANIMLEPTREPFTVEARFKTARDKAGPEITVRLENMRCAQGEEP